MLAAGRIYLIDQKGSTTVFAAGADYELLAVNRLDEPCNASIVVSGGNLFIPRTNTSGVLAKGNGAHRHRHVTPRR